MPCSRTPDTQRTRTASRWVSDVAAQITPFGHGANGQTDDQVAAPNGGNGRGCHRPVYHTLRLAPDADVLVRRHHDHPRQVPGAEGRGSPVSFRVPGSARDYLDITDSKGLHWGLDLGCVADQDGD